MFSLTLAVITVVLAAGLIAEAWSVLGANDPYVTATRKANKS